MDQGTPYTAYNLKRPSLYSLGLSWVFKNACDLALFSTKTTPFRLVNPERLILIGSFKSICKMAIGSRINRSWCPIAFTQHKELPQMTWFRLCSLIHYDLFDTLLSLSPFTDFWTCGSISHNFSSDLHNRCDAQNVRFGFVYKQRWGAICLFHWKV